MTLFFAHEEWTSVVRLPREHWIARLDQVERHLEQALGVFGVLLRSKFVPLQYARKFYLVGRRTLVLLAGRIRFESIWEMLRTIEEQHAQTRNKLVVLFIVPLGSHFWLDDGHLAEIAARCAPAVTSFHFCLEEHDPVMEGHVTRFKKALNGRVRLVMVHSFEEIDATCPPDVRPDIDHALATLPDWARESGTFRTDR